MAKADDISSVPEIGNRPARRHAEAEERYEDHVIAERLEGAFARLLHRWGIRRSLLPGYVFGLSVLGATLWFAGDIAPSCNVALTRTISVLAGILGWIAGIMSLPETPWQETHFNRGWSAISTFAGGAFVGQLVQAFSNVKLWQPYDWARIVLAATWFCIGLLFTGAPRLLQPNETPPKA